MTTDGGAGCEDDDDGSGSRDDGDRKPSSKAASTKWFETESTAV